MRITGDRYIAIGAWSLAAWFVWLTYWIGMPHIGLMPIVLAVWVILIVFGVNMWRHDY